MIIQSQPQCLRGCKVQMVVYNGGMIYIHAKCDHCGKPVIRNAAVCRYANVKKHFCTIECKSEFQRSAKPVTKEWLYEQYVVNGRDTSDIGREVNRDPKSVWNWLKDFGIPTRKRGFASKHQFKKGELNAFAGQKHTAETRAKLRKKEIHSAMSVIEQSITDRYAIYNGDSCEVLKGVASESIHISIYSPPFCRFIPLFKL